MTGNGGWAGGCMCGAIRYRIAKTASAPTICHCESCRRSAGAPIVAWVTAPADAVEFEGGPRRIYRSAGKVERGFCPTCGTTLTYRHLDHADFLDIATATLDDPESLPPEDQIWTADRLSYMKEPGVLPSHERTRKG